MALVTVDTLRTVELAVGQPDQALVTAAGEINSAGIALRVSSTSATVDGYVHTTSASDEAVYLVAADLTVGSTGRIFGSDTGAFAVNGGTINNAGTISANGEAIFGINNVLHVVNSGTIEALNNIAIYFNNGVAGTDRLEVSNSGTIRALSVAILAVNTHDLVINSGHIETAGSLAISLGGGNDVYEGRAGSTVEGKIDLGAGDDTAFGGAGDEIFDGGADRDTYCYVGNANLTVDLSITATQATGQGNDRFLNFENLSGGDGSDWLAGNTVDNEIEGGGGNDTLLGGSGNDTLRGGAGSNLLDGGIGADTLDGTNGAGVASYQHAADAVLVDLGSETVNTGEAAGDHYVSLTAVWGSTFGDTIRGTADANWFVGDEGADSLVGGTGNDSLHGSAGSDTLLGGADNDFLDGGDGVDTAIYTGSGNINVDLRRTTAQDTGEGVDTLVGIENVSGGSGADTLKGDAQSNLLVGNAGNDTLVGVGGNDTAVFAGSKGDYTIVKNGDGTVTVTGPDGTDQLTGIRNLTFADSTELLPNAAPDAVGLSATTIAENILPTTILANLSAHDPDGDAVTYALASNPDGFFAIDGDHLILTRALDFETQTQHSVTVEAIDVFGARLSQTFTLSVTDMLDTDVPLILSGTRNADTLTGASMNDILYGLAGNDRLYGGAGNDRLYGGAGKDILNGGAGQDIFVLNTKPNKKTNVDRIVDFAVTDDTIHLIKSVFSKIAKKGVLAKSAFYTGLAAHDSSDRMIYNKKTGALFYDRDGNGELAQIQIATLPKKLKMKHLDFFTL